MYFFPPVPSGTYDLKATLIGYLVFVQTVTVVEGEVQELNIEMKQELPPPTS